MAIPYNNRDFTYKGFSFPSECPFFPVYKGISGNFSLFNFNQGYVFNYPDSDTGGEADYIVVSGMTTNWEVSSGDIFYLKLTLSSGVVPELPPEEQDPNVETVQIPKGKVETAELIQVSLDDDETVILADTPNVFFIKVCSFGADGSIDEIFLRENIHWNGNGSGSEIIHPWKITEGTSPNTWDVRGGYIYDHNNVAILVADTTVEIEAGYICLAIARNESSRVIETAGLLVPTIGTFLVIPTSTQYTQYFVLGQVGDSTNPIIQMQFQEIKVFEMLIVANGEFKFGNFQMMGANNYDLP